MAVTRGWRLGPGAWGRACWGLSCCLSAPLCTHRLCSCELGAPSGRHLAEALLQNQGLTHLSLRRNRLGDVGVRALSEALSPAACRLQRLE